MVKTTIGIISMILFVSFIVFTLYIIFKGIWNTLFVDTDLKSKYQNLLNENESLKNKFDNLNGAYTRLNDALSETKDLCSKYARENKILKNKIEEQEIKIVAKKKSKTKESKNG